MTERRLKMEKLCFDNIPVRFFVWEGQENYGTYEHDFVECDEQTFLEAEGAIEYARHTVFANGVSQICLTKDPFK